jgi:NhaP-type Na+/H+ or K+/H+ antiporter
MWCGEAMETYLSYLLYLALLLLLGIVLTAVSTRLRLSNLLFLVIAGYTLKEFGLDLLTDDMILILSSLAIIVMSLETTMRMDVAHVLRNFFHVLKFNIVHFLLCVYTLTLAIFLLFDFPAKGFEEFVLCMLLSILIYGTDASIVMEFFRERKSRMREILEIEGIISGPVVVVFAFFLIDYLHSSAGDFSAAALVQTGVFLQKIVAALLLAAAMAWFSGIILKRFPMSAELQALFAITVGMLTLILGEVVKTDGGFAAVFFGLLLRAFAKERIMNIYNTMLAHIIYIVLFITLGMQFSLPDGKFWLQSIGVFSFYLMVRFACVVIFLKETTLGEKFFITLNAAKGIEVAVALFLLTVLFKHVAALQMIASIGFLMMLYSYVVATIANHYSDAFLERKIEKKAKLSTAR